MTYGDLIRQMTDEEIGKMLYFVLDYYRKSQMTEDDFVFCIKSEVDGFNGDGKEQTDAID